MSKHNVPRMNQLLSQTFRESLVLKCQEEANIFSKIGFIVCKSVLHFSVRPSYGSVMFYLLKINGLDNTYIVCRLPPLPFTRRGDRLSRRVNLSLMFPIMRMEKTAYPNVISTPCIISAGN
jgi:hypothetical protein